MRGYAAVGTSKSHPRPPSTSSILLTPELIEEYLEALEETGCKPDTQKNYQVKLLQLYQYLPEDKRIRADTLTQWRDALVDAGYAPSTVNVCTAAANGLVIHCGHREFQVEKPLKASSAVQPELTRSEYLRLLSTARILGKEQEYLLIKVFGSTGLTVRDLPKLTVAAVQDGKLRLSSSVMYIPDCLRKELLVYIQREGLTSGPVFVTRAGTPFKRTSISSMIQRLSRDAQVPGDKVNPRCLKKLYQTTQASIHANVSLLVAQAYDRLLEAEQLAIGWNQREASE